MFRYAITIFLSAFLLFQVQPLIGKFILPWFGGTPAIWTTCMLFFQIVLLAGYSYAHLVSSSLPPKVRTGLHLALLAASLYFLPIIPDGEAWKPSGDELPIGRILGLLAATIGLPYFLLSSTGPLLQESFRRETGRTPYRLYSLSNVGSLLALLSYPIVFEPQFALQTQIMGWSTGYVAFVVGCAWCTLGFLREPAQTAEAEAAASGPRPGTVQILLWLALAACGSVMLLATTNQLCMEITSVPFLWVVPLAIYLFTFIVCFDHERWYHRNAFFVGLVASVAAAVFALFKGNALGLFWQVAIYSLTLFMCCMVCHGELTRSKPAPRYATLFYLLVSAGGAIGGLFVAIVVPLVLTDFWEYQIGLVATALTYFVAINEGSRTESSTAAPPSLRWMTAAAGVVGLSLGLGWWLATIDNANEDERNLETSRNFYGVLRVNEEDNLLSDNGPRRELIHGRIQHGFQFLDEDKRRWPTTYYGRTSGVGVAITHHPHRKAENAEDRTLKIGVVGLGCGTLAAYGEKGDIVRFYEINPEVIRISDEFFTFRKDSPAKVEVVLGDARIKMEQERAEGKSQQFDVLAVDAFSSDSIPMHLLTKECVELFRYHLKPNGLLCIHISNRFLDLGGVVLGIAQELGCECKFVDAERDGELGTDWSTWGIITTNTAFLNDPEVQATFTSDDYPPVVWTDDYGSLWQVLNYNSLWKGFN